MSASMTVRTVEGAIDEIITSLWYMPDFRRVWMGLTPEGRAGCRKAWHTIIQQCINENMHELTRQFREGDAI